MNATALEKAITRLAGTPIVIVGDPCLDEYVEGEVEGIAKEAPVLALSARRRSFAPGQAANVAVNAAALGAKVSLFGLAGQDENRDQLLNLLGGKGVDATFLSEKGRPTTHKVKFVGIDSQRHHQHLFHVYWESSQAARRASGRELRAGVARALGTARAVVLSDYGDGTIGTSLVKWLFEAAGPRPVIVNARDGFRRFRGAAVIVANRAEIAGFARGSGGDDDVRRYVAHAREALACRYLVMTLGEEGMVVAASGGRTRHLPSAAREVVDVTGAGDTVTAALATAFGAGLGFETAAEIANLAAAVSVSRPGTAAPAAAELLAFLGGLSLLRRGRV